jgi:PAS domain-containing protein
MHQTAGFLQLVMDNIPQYIFWKDRNSVYLGCNHRWAEMAGFDGPSEVIGITEADLPWTEEEKAWYLECDRRVMDTGVPTAFPSPVRYDFGSEITVYQGSQGLCCTSRKREPLYAAHQGVPTSGRWPN